MRHWIFCGFFLALYLAAGLCDEDIQDIWVIGLFPFNGSWAGGQGQYPAVQLGLEDVNKDPSILPGYRLKMTVNDTDCDAGIGTNAMFQQLYQQPTKLMVLGAGCSHVSQATAQVSHLWNLVQMSYSSASPALTEKSKYKRFFRVFPSEASFNPAKFALLHAFKWKKIGTLHQAEEDLFALTTDKFIFNTAKEGIELLRMESFLGDPRQAVRNLKKHDVRIIVGNFYENKARVIFCEAFKEGMFGSKYVWIITGFYTPQWWKEEDPENPHDCTISQLEQAIDGYFTADALPLSRMEGAAGISGRTHKEFIDLYHKRTGNAKLTGHQEAPYGYDSVWAIAKMLNNSMEYMQENGWNRGLEDFDYSDEEMGTLFLQQMNTTEFEGVSGPVLFDSSGDRRGLTQIEQLQDGKEVMVGVFDPREGNKITWENDTPIIWKDGNPPPDSITEKIKNKAISVGLFICMTIAASLGIVLSCFFLVFNIKYRHRKYIKMSSPNMNNVILAGAILAFMSVIFGGIDSNIVPKTSHLIMCKFYNWTLSLGFSLAFGAMFSKTWRVHKIFTNKKIQRMVIKDYQLIAIVCVLVGLDVLVLTVWEFLDPLRIIVYNRTSIPDPENPDNQVLIPQQRFCESPHMWYYAGIIYAIKGLLLVFGAFLAFETRKVTVPALNDSKFIGISVYNVVVLCLIGVPVALMMKEQVDAAYALISLFIFFGTTVTICLVFIPKIAHRNKEPHSGTMWNKTVDSSAAQKKAMLSTCMTDVEKRELDQIKEENNTLRAALEQCQRRLRELECLQANGTSPMTISEDILPSEPVTPVTPEAPDLMGGISL